MVINQSLWHDGPDVRSTQAFEARSICLFYRSEYEYLVQSKSDIKQTHLFDAVSIDINLDRCDAANKYAIEVRNTIGNRRLSFEYLPLSLSHI